MPKDVYNEFMVAESLGKFFYKNIRSKYPATEYKQTNQGDVS